jgi:hypothetical protein
MRFLKATDYGSIEWFDGLTGQQKY